MRDIGGAICTGKGLDAGLTISHLPLTPEQLEEKRQREAPRPKAEMGSGFFGHILHAMEQEKKRKTDLVHATSTVVSGRATSTVVSETI